MRLGQPTLHPVQGRGHVVCASQDRRVWQHELSARPDALFAFQAPELPLIRQIAVCCCLWEVAGEVGVDALQVLLHCAAVPHLSQRGMLRCYGSVQAFVMYEARKTARLRSQAIDFYSSVIEGRGIAGERAEGFGMLSAEISKDECMAGILEIMAVGFLVMQKRLQR